MKTVLTKAVLLGRWKRYCLHQIPSPANSSNCQFVTYSSFFAPFRNCFGFHFPIKFAYIALIAKLFKASGPAAIFRFVISVYVNSVEGMLRGWSRTHVAQKILKRVVPQVANFNAATAVIIKAPILRTIAPPAHCDPSAVFGRVSHPMFKLYFAAHFFMEAAARLGKTAHQVRTRNCLFVPTIAFAFVFCGIADKAQCANKPPEAPAQKIDFNHARHITCNRLCEQLYYDNGFPIEGMPAKCFCSDVVDKKTAPPLPITLRLYGPPSPPKEQFDDRPKRDYDD